ncbi:MAG: hypothetical protein L6425_11490, partial [Candidatus Aminicenantes bacterium]|nr:hypothetical protein [Candidatus Aminicenantes bacterium]
LDYGISLNIGIFKGLDIKIDNMFYFDKGKTTLSLEETSFFMVTTSLGLQVSLKIAKLFNPYFGGGGCFTYYHENDFIYKTYGTAFGYQIEFGDYIYLSKNVWIDLNFRYIDIKARPYDETINLGGLRSNIGFCLGLR